MPSKMVKIVPAVPIPSARVITAARVYTNDREQLGRLLSRDISHQTAIERQHEMTM
jgi:hypothetical protein